MRSLLLALLITCISSASAQLINGSFEDGQGNFDVSGWTSTCPMIPGPAAPGFGAFGAMVNHSNAGCSGWSRATYLVPTIADGETWTLSGWCGVFTWPFFSPQVGFGLGWKDAGGVPHFFTAPVTNNGSYTYLQVTNTFALAPGDTAFVELDPGTAGGGSGNQLFAMYDGLELSSLSTGITDVTSLPPLHIHPNPVVDRLWVAVDDVVMDVQVVAADGSVSRPSVVDHGNTLEVDVTGRAPGVQMLLVRTASGLRTARFVQL